MIVVAIIAVLAAIAIPSYSKYNLNAQRSAASRRSRSRPPDCRQTESCVAAAGNAGATR